MTALSPPAASSATIRSLAFNVQAFRVAVDVRTGEVRILQSVQAADAGTVMNPEQCRGQVEGGAAQAIGTSLYEEVLIGDERGGDQPGVPHLPDPADGRHPDHRGVFRGDQRPSRPVRREVDEREPVQPGGAGAWATRSGGPSGFARSRPRSPATGSGGCSLTTAEGIRYPHGG